MRFSRFVTLLCNQAVFEGVGELLLDEVKAGIFVSTVRIGKEQIVCVKSEGH